MRASGPTIGTQDLSFEWYPDSETQFVLGFFYNFGMLMLMFVAGAWLFGKQQSVMLFGSTTEKVVRSGVAPVLGIAPTTADFVNT